MTKERKIYIATFALLFAVIPIGLGQLVPIFGQSIIDLSKMLSLPLMAGRMAITIWYAKHSGSRQWVSILFGFLSLMLGGAAVIFGYLVLRRESKNEVKGV